MEIRTIDDIVEFEQQYIENYPQPDFMFEEESYGADEGVLCFLRRRIFQSFSKCKASWIEKYRNYGLTDVESLVMATYLSNISGLYRLDAYRGNVPQEILSLCNILESALAKLPPVDSKLLTRLCVTEDKTDFKVGEIYEPIHNLTTSDLPCEITDELVYEIIPLPPYRTKGRCVYVTKMIENEKQVTFLRGARFKVTNVLENRIFLQEII